ncbi:MAG: class I SAM-dependent methyltransferase [Bacilli bacterium]|nr:class I SAM-dependent methyltransferase [Bacilli bacterium]
MPQYFDNAEYANEKSYTYDFSFNGKKYRLLGATGTFNKGGFDEGTRFLLETIVNLDLGKNILDIGCGVGPIGLILASADSSRHITMSDVNLRALALAKENVEFAGVSSQCEIISSDVYSSINSVYDTIVSNPPIHAGKKVTYRIYDESVEHLKEGGSLIIVIRKQQGALSVKEHLISIFNNKVEVLDRHKGYYVIKATK